ncbi:maltose-6'-phosphate glucosidase [Eremococcus coleocola]|uniref:family 4 glycosyl hydrolase n=1 Tax=Eremococcus coleocola TaxID=88132 RepID=UPI0003F9A29F|nr:maltose-6'-phosphate glucosidase [Eremococcus coleocola]
MKKYKITIAGAGSGYTPGIVFSILNHKEFEIEELRLYDIDKDRNSDMYIILKYLFDQNDIPVTLLQTEDPKIAFTGIDFVFSQIRVGGIQMREKDEKIPLKYGLVGQETCGLGGFSYGLRSMKGFLELVGYIQKYAPEAWILNYTNPESIISESVRRKFPDAKIVNACDMTIGIEEIITNSFGYKRENWIQTYYGLNHFGWYKSIYDVSVGKDVLPEIIQKVKEEGFDVSSEEESWAKTYNNLAKMIEIFPDSIPNNYLEYYLYPNWYVDNANKKYTRANQIMDGRLKKIKETVQLIKSGKATGDLGYNGTDHGKYIVDIAASIIHNKNDRFMLIVPNMGAIPNLRGDAVVEVPCYVNAQGVEPISLRFNIPDFHKGLMEAQVAAEKLLVDAFFENSYQKALKAFTLNQSVPNGEVAKKILDEFIEVNGEYWVELK